ncbi:MAG: NAD synthetase [Alphaproteobacteria bacterium]|nr:NAD synthetase [Alphaproteobacteria bacterium]
MDPATIADNAARLANNAQGVVESAAALAQDATQLALTQTAGGGDIFVFLFAVFVLAVFVGYYVVWSVTPALHSPLMAVTNAISSVIIVGALIAAGPSEWDLSKTFGFIAVVLASINIFGGFIVAQRMLAMFKAKQ